MLSLLVFQFLSIFTYFFTKHRRKMNHRKKYIGSIFTYHFFSFYHIFSPASGYHHKGSRKETCNKLLPVFHPIKKINLQTRWVNSNLAHYKICKELYCMHMTSAITMTINGTQGLCQCSSKLNHFSSSLYDINLSMRKKIVGFSFPSFILMSILCQTVSISWKEQLQ